MIGLVLFQTLGAAMTPISEPISRCCGILLTLIFPLISSLNRQFSFRAPRRLLNGMDFLALVLLPPSKRSGSPKVSKPRKDGKDMQTTCLKACLSTLALHFTATNALDDEVRSTEDPEGALLLSVVACEHALTQCVETGEIVLSTRKRDNHFSEEMWSEPAIWYQSPIQKLSPESWDLIIDRAWKISQEKKASRVTSNCVDSKMPKADERELLAEGDEVVENDEIVWDSCVGFLAILRLSCHYNTCLVV
ncbi:hypothetical protein BJV74DRAFT_871948 [Russula compacta]|nr:hypothetical protein BJV74DRAFT_871948 [Russula compacta]